MNNFNINQKTCIHCGICLEVCPANVISPKDNVVSFNYSNHIYVWVVDSVWQYAEQNLL